MVTSGGSAGFEVRSGRSGATVVQVPARIDVTAMCDQLYALRRSRRPERRVELATDVLKGLAELSAEVSAVRVEALRCMRAGGASFGEIAEVAGLTRARVAQLLKDPAG